MMCLRPGDRTCIVARAEVHLFDRPHGVPCAVLRSRMPVLVVAIIADGEKDVWWHLVIGPTGVPGWTRWGLESVMS